MEGFKDFNTKVDSRGQIKTCAALPPCAHQSRRS
jgi:hypothetical protein